jgi:DNA polymerase-4
MKIKYSDFTQQTRNSSFTFISDKGLILEIVKELLYQNYEDSITTVRISLSNKYRRKKTLALQLKFAFNFVKHSFNNG